MDVFMEKIKDVDDLFYVSDKNITKSVFVGNRREIITVSLDENYSEKALVIGLSPYIQDGEGTDMTIIKTSKFLKQYGISEFTMINLFETVVKDEDITYKITDFTKYKNLFDEADLIVVAWGNQLDLETEKNAMDFLVNYKNKLCCIENNKGIKPIKTSAINYSYKLVHFLPHKKKYPVVTLCGSTRFKDEFIKVQKDLTLKGYIVISVGLFGHSGDNEVWDFMDEGSLTKTKIMLDDMHKAKIDMSDEIFVINVGGYIGESTKSEIEYAIKKGKVVNYLEN